MLASSITLVMSAPCCLQIKASWFAKATLTSLKVFSAVLAISTVAASVSITALRLFFHHGFGLAELPQSVSCLVNLEPILR